MALDDDGERREVVRRLRDLVERHAVFSQRFGHVCDFFECELIADERDAITRGRVAPPDPSVYLG